LTKRWAVYRQQQRQLLHQKCQSPTSSRGDVFRSRCLSQFCQTQFGTLCGQCCLPCSRWTETTASAFTGTVTE